MSLPVIANTVRMNAHDNYFQAAFAQLRPAREN